MRILELYQQHHREYFKSMRNGLGYTQDQFATLLGYKRLTVINIENGKGTTVYTSAHLAAAFAFYSNFAEEQDQILLSEIRQELADFVYAMEIEHDIYKSPDD